MTGPSLDESHDPSLRSWVAPANDPGCDFPIQNLPFGVFTLEGHGRPRVGVAIGDAILDLARCRELGLLTGSAALLDACSADALNELMALDAPVRKTLRLAISRLLRSGAGTHAAVAEAIRPMAHAVMQLPARIGDYTDFYASIFHATNVGMMLRPDEPLLPNYKHVPIGYHGRASSIVPSSTPVRRPSGQARSDASGDPSFGPSRRLDYELEVGVFTGPGNSLGTPIPIHRAESHVFGLCLLNDWSARDVQQWEYQPLGPFLAKSFATSISPWVVTLEALAPFRAAAFPRPDGDPAPLPYLSSEQDRTSGGLDLRLEVSLRSARMRSEGLPAHVVARSNARYLYWTIAQLVTHHASNGCNLRPGDLLATGTVSGPTRDSRGCLLEATWRGTEPATLPSGEIRRFLEDGDEVVFRGWCERAGHARIGFGECRGTIEPAL